MALIFIGISFLSNPHAFILGFIPPSQITTISTGSYPVVMVIGTIILIAPVFFFYHQRRRPIPKPQTVGGADAAPAPNR